MKNLIAIAAFVGIAGVLAAGIYLSGHASGISDTGSILDSVSEPKGPDRTAKTPVVGPVISKTGPWPKTVVPESDFLFGQMQVGQELEHSFSIRNEGDVDLELTAGDPTCKCTVFKLNRTTVPPGEEAELLVRWKGAFRDASFEHGGPVYTNDPKNNPIRFTVRGVVDEAISWRPEGSWDVGEVPIDSPAKMHAAVYSNVFSDFEILSMTAGSEFVSLTAKKASGAALSALSTLSGYEIDVSVAPEIPAGAFEDEIRVVVDKLDEPVVIPLKAFKPGSIRILPTVGVTWIPKNQGLILGRFPVSEGRTAKLLLLVDEAGMDSPLELTETETDPSFIKVTLTPEGKASGTLHRYFLTVIIPPGIPRTSRETENPGTIRCKTNHPSGEVLLLKLKFNSF